MSKGLAINSSKTFTLACAVDNTPRLFPELILWLTCVEKYLPKEQFQPIVYMTKDVPTEIRVWVESRGVKTKCFYPPVTGSPHCNRIAPLLDSFNTDNLIVTDVDLFLINDISGFFRSSGIRAAPNNSCNPPAYIFDRLMEAQNWEVPCRHGVSLLPNHQGNRATYVNNISCGMVGMPTNRSVAFAELWLKWANWLVANRELLENWSIHIDQVAFALTMEEIGEDVEFLPPQLNCVLELLPQISSVYGFHLSTAHIPQFPTLFDSNRRMSVENFAPTTEASVARLNIAINEALSEINKLPSDLLDVDSFLNSNWTRSMVRTEHLK